MLSLLWVTGTTSPRVLLHDWKLKHPIMAAEAFAVFAAIWQHGDLLTGQDVIFFIDNEAAASAMIKGDSRLPVVGTMAMCVQLLLIRYKIAIWFECQLKTWQMASAEMVRKILGHWISIGNYTNSKAFLSQSHLLRCENNSFQSLLTIDQSDQLEYVRRLVPCLSVRCLGPIVQEFEHSFFSRFRSVSAVRNFATSHSHSLSVGPWQPYFGIFQHHRVQLRLERLYTISFWSLAHFHFVLAPFPVPTLRPFPIL